MTKDEQVAEDFKNFDKSQPHRELKFQPQDEEHRLLSTPCPVYTSLKIGSIACQLDNNCCGAVDVKKGICYCQHPCMV